MCYLESFIDCPEDRFGRYRQLSGAQYHISIKRIFRSLQLRLQKVPELPDLDAVAPCGSTRGLQVILNQFHVVVEDADVAGKQSMLPAITYVAGYCADRYKEARMHLLQGKLGDRQPLPWNWRGCCVDCEDNKRRAKVPQAVVVHAVLMMQIVLNKLRSEKLASKFYASSKHKEVLVALTICKWVQSRSAKKVIRLKWWWVTFRVPLQACCLTTYAKLRTTSSRRTRLLSGSRKLLKHSAATSPFHWNLK